MRILARLTFITLLLFAVVSALDSVAFAQAGGGQAAASTQNRLVGEVQSVSSGGELTVKTDDGRMVTLKAEERVSVQRIPPGETNAQNATRITLADVIVGDRVFARGALSEDGKSFSARQLVVANKQAITQVQSAQREDWQRRGIAGRIEAINAQKKEITIRARSREGAQSVVVDASGNVKFLRNAPDSSRAQDAVPSSFADLKVGDQLRARGTRSTDGARFTAEEIMASNIQRTGGTVQSVNASANEIVVKNDQTGQTQTILIGQRSLLRRITPELASQMAARRNQTAGAGGVGGGGGDGANAGRRGAGGNGRRGPGGAGRGGGFQEMLQSLPALSIGELKKGDVVMVTGSQTGSDNSRLTAMMLITGDDEFIKRLMQLQGRPNRDGQNMSPGLPSDVVGGGTTNTREQP